MTPEEIQKLLGGYATGTLTREEEQALFAAALDDQELFDALAKEQALRDLLRDPAARAHLLASIGERKRRWWQFGNRWVLAGATVAACLAAAAGIYFIRTKPPAHPVLVAELKPDAPPVPRNQIVIQQTPAQPQISEIVTMPKPSAAKRTPAPARQEPMGQLGRRDKDAPLQGRETLSLEKLKADAPAPASAPSPPAAAPAAPPAQAAGVGGVTPQSMVVVEAKAPVVSENKKLADVQVNRARALFYGTPGVVGGLLPSGQNFSANGPATSNLVALPNLGVKWTALRKQADGLFTEVDPEQIKAGDTVKLRLVPNDNGYLTILDGKTILAQDQLARRLVPFETPEITSEAGKKELTVVLARQPQPVKNVLQADAAPQAKKQEAASLVRAAATDQLSQPERSEHAVYEVSTGNNWRAPVRVRIVLNFQ